MPSFVSPALWVLLGLCLLGGLWLALTPMTGPPPPWGPWDKVEHAVGFYVLGALSLAAFPAAARWKLFVGLTAYGALVEVLQATPSLNRHADPFDLAADLLGIGMALLPTYLRRGEGPEIRAKSGVRGVRG